MMKYLWISILILLTACQGEKTDQTNTVSDNGFYSKLKDKIEVESRPEAMGLGVIKYEEDEHDFGEITEGDIVIHEFFFTNIGAGPLIVRDVETRCGCTVPEWTQTPILPGEQGRIQVAFNSNDLPGKQSKAIIVYTNGRPYKTALVIRAFVNPKES